MPKYQDIRNTGRQSYKSLLSLNALQQNVESALGFKHFNFGPLRSKVNDVWSGPVASPIMIQSGGKDWIGNSYWDRDSYTEDDIYRMMENPNELRALDLPGYIKLLNGVGKMAELAVSTFLNSTLGLIAGLGQGIYNATQGESFVRGFWDNDITKGLLQMNEEFESILPNYYTQQELESPWYQNIFTANFFGDKLLKNMGFTIGAIGAAYVTGGLGLGSLAGRGLQALGAGANTVRNATNIVNGVVNTTLSAAGEASIEAYLAVHDGMKNNELAINNYIQTEQLKLQEEMLNNIDSGVDPAIALGEYRTKLQQVELNANKMRTEYLKNTTELGNSVFGSNMAILSVTNALEFGNIMKGGWGTNKLFSKLDDRIERTVGDKVISNSASNGDAEFARGIIRGESKYRVGMKDPSEHTGKMMLKSGIKNMFTEGFEEGAQRFASDTAQIRAAALTQKYAETNGLIDHALNPDVTSAMVDYSEAMTKAWADSFGGAGKSGWEEVALGAITGLLGVPMIGKRKNGKLGLTLAGGFSQEYRDAKREYESIANRVAEMNKFIDSKKMRDNLLRGTANISMLQASRMALFNDDHVLFKNILALRSANTALFLNQQHDLGNGYSAAVDELASNLTDEDVQHYKEIKAKETGGEIEDLFKGKTNEEIKEIIREDMTDYKKLVERALTLSDKIEKDKKAQKLTGFAHDEFFSSYVLRDNIATRISQIEEENQRLNEDDPLEKSLLEKNNKDLARLREDKRILDNRIESALNNPRAFLELVDKKVANLQKAYVVKQNEEKIKQLQKASSINEVAAIMDTIELGSKDIVLNKAYEESNEDTKKVLDDYKNFHDALDTIFFKLQQVFNNKLRNNSDRSKKDIVTAAQRANDAMRRIEKDETMQNWYNAIAAENSNITIEDLLLQVDNQNDEKLSKKFQLFVNDYNIINSILDSINNISDTEDALNLDALNQYKELSKLMYSVYEDLIFKNDSGLSGLTLAEEIRKNLDTLEASQSLDPAILDDIKQVLSELDSVDKIRSIANKTRDERKKRREESIKEAKENKEKKEDKKKEKGTEEPKKKTKKDTNKQEPTTDENGTVHYSLSQAFDKVGITPSDNVIKLQRYGIMMPVNSGINVATQLNEANENVEIAEYPFRELKNVEVLKDFIGELLNGYIVDNGMLKSYLKALNKYVTDEIVAWAENSFKVVELEEESEEEEEDNDNKKDNKKKGEARPPKPDNSKIEPTDYPGNNFTEFYPGTWVKKKGKDGEERWENPWKMMLERMTKSAPSLEMFADGIHPQFFIDNLLHKIITKNPDIKLRYIVRTVDRYDEESGETVPSTNIYLGFAKRDIEEADPDLLSQYDESNLSIKSTNDGDYIIFGTMGYFSDARKTVVSRESKVASPQSSIITFEQLKKKLMEDRNKFAEDKNEFYVDTELFNFVKPMSTTGEIITATDSEKSSDVVIIDEDFLASEYRNPHHLDASNMQFMFILGKASENNVRPDYALRGLDNENDEIFYELSSQGNPGSVYLYIPTANGNMIPIYLKPVMFEDIADRAGLKESQWYNNILDYAKILFNPAITDAKTKKEAIGRIRDALLFTGDLKLSYDVETDTVQKYGKNTPKDVIQDLEEFEQFLIDANPRVAINKNQINGLNGTEYLKQLMLIGALLTDVKILGTKKAMFYIYGMKKNFKVDRKETVKPEANKHPHNTSNEIWLSFEQNGKTKRLKFIIKDDGSVYDVNGELITDKNIKNQIDFIRRIQNGKGNPFKYKAEGKKVATQYYIFSPTEVYVHGTRNYAKVNKNTALAIYAKYKELMEKEAKKDEVKKKIDSKPIEVDLGGTFDDDGNFSPDELIIISRDDLVEPIDIDGELQVSFIYKEGDVVDLWIDDGSSEPVGFLKVKLNKKLLKFEEDKKISKEEEEKLEKKTENKKEENKIIKPLFFSSMKPFLEGRTSKWDYYTEDESNTRDTKDGVLILGLAINQLDLAITLAIVSGILEEKYRLEIDPKSHNAIVSILNSEKAREAVKQLKRLKIRTPALLIEYIEKNATEEEKLEPKKKPEEENKKPAKKRAKKFASRSNKGLDNSENDGTFVAEIEKLHKNTIQKAYRANSKENKEIINKKIADKQGESLKDIEALSLPLKIDLMYQLVNDYIKKSGDSITFETLTDSQLLDLFACKI